MSSLMDLDSDGEVQEEALEEGEVVEDGEIDEARRGPLLSLDGSLFRQPV